MNSNSSNIIKKQALVSRSPAFVRLWTLINETAVSLCYELLVEETELKTK